MSVKGMLVLVVTALVVVAGCAADEGSDSTVVPDAAGACVEGTVDCNDTPNGDLPPDALPPNDGEEPPAGPDASLAVSVQEARDHAGGDPIVVTGFYLRDAESARLCDLVLESFPPQCGGASLVVSNPDAMTEFVLVEEGGKQWSEGFVVVSGVVSGETLTVVSP